jgi:anti-anti-sigma factor
MVQIRRDRPGLASAKQVADSNRLGARCHVELARFNGVAYVVLVGELDLSCNQRFLESLKRTLADRPDDLVIDLRSVTFVDSTGLALLVKANKLAREDGFRLHIVRSPAEIVQAVLETSGLERLLPLCHQSPRFRT